MAAAVSRQTIACASESSDGGRVGIDLLASNTTVVKSLTDFGPRFTGELFLHYG
jgi:hypothetical protein